MHFMENIWNSWATPIKSPFGIVIHSPQIFPTKKHDGQILLWTYPVVGLANWKTNLSHFNFVQFRSVMAITL